MRLRYRLYTSLIFALAAIITLPLQQIFSYTFLDRKEPSLLQLLNSAGVGSLFAVAAFFWGGLLTSRFRRAGNRGLFSHLIICFFWGIFITILTIISTTVFVGLVASYSFTQFISNFMGVSLGVLIFGTFFTFGLIYFIGGIAGIIAGLYFRRTTHNEQG